MCILSMVSRISIHSLHTEGDIYHVTVACTRRISIHSLHTEGDEHANVSVQPTSHFNPLPPHGGRLETYHSVTDAVAFQSTPSTRRETALIVHTMCAQTFQSTPSTRRETTNNKKSGSAMGFQSTPSTRRETFCGRIHMAEYFISIHSLHTEGDSLRI